MQIMTINNKIIPYNDKDIFIKILLHNFKKEIFKSLIIDKGIK